MFLKHNKNVPFSEARKIINRYIGTKPCANVENQKQIKHPMTTPKKINTKN